MKKLVFLFAILVSIMVNTSCQKKEVTESSEGILKLAPISGVDFEMHIAYTNDNGLQNYYYFNLEDNGTLNVDGGDYTITQTERDSMASLLQTIFVDDWQAYLNSWPDAWESWYGTEPDYTYPPGNPGEYRDIFTFYMCYENTNLYSPLHTTLTIDDINWSRMDGVPPARVSNIILYAKELHDTYVE